MTPTHERPDAATASVVVLGLGPAGRSVTHLLARAGVDVVAVDTAPDRPWRPTYAAWHDELPAWLPPTVVSTTSPARAFATSEHELARRYCVLDTVGLQQHLSLGGARVVAARVLDADAHRVHLDHGTALTADLVVDARGSRPDPTLAQQTAIGVVLPRSSAPMLEQTWFMDWRRDNGTGPGDPPSFLYVVPLDDEHVLVEETCLVGRPALGFDELRRRLHTRLAARGIRLTGDEREEHVRFAVEAPAAPADPTTPTSPARMPGGRRATTLRLGARGGLMHPATGYSVALALDVADRVANAVADGTTTASDLEALVWPRPARRVQALRAIGLTTLLRLPAHGVAQFFEAFFRLPTALQRGYLTDREHPALTLAAMASMAARLPPSLTKVAVTSALPALPSTASVTRGRVR